MRYLPRHDWPGTILLIALIVAAAGFGFATYRLARRTLRGQPVTFRWRPPWREARIYLGGTTLLLAIALSAISYGAINGVRTDQFELADPQTWVPRTFARFGFSPFANLWEADVSTKSGNWTGLSTRPEDKLKGDLLEKARAALVQVKGASLHGANLRYANAVRAFLARADLRKANLQKTDLWQAKLQDARLQKANLQGAFLRDTDFQGGQPQRRQPPGGRPHRRRFPWGHPQPR